MKRVQWLLPLVAILGACLVGLFFSSATGQKLDTLRQVDTPALLRAQSLSFNLSAVHESFSYAAAAAEKSAMAQAEEKVHQFRNELKALSELPTHAATAQALGTQFDTYVTAASQLMAHTMAMRRKQII